MLSKRLLAARRKRRLTRAELAARAGVKPNIIQDIERGKTEMPGFDRLVRLARALDMDPEELCPVPERKAS
jgi:transcriptional regulator with XRE-family HTH domain